MSSALISGISLVNYTIYLTYFPPLSKSNLIYKIQSYLYLFVSSHLSAINFASSTKSISIAFLIAFS